MATATLALAGFFVALYLWLWKVGAVGNLACGVGGGCEFVQTSPQSALLGVPVALYGVLGYAALLGVSLVGLQPRWVSRREPTAALVVLSSMGVAFSVYLTYLEAFVLHAWCRWCVTSAVIISAIFAVSLAGMVGVGRAVRR